MRPESSPIPHRELGKRLTAAGVIVGIVSAVSPVEASPQTAKEIIKERETAPWSFLMKAPDMVGNKGLNLSEEVALASERSPLTFYCEIKDLMAIPGFDAKKKALDLIDKNPHAFIACAQESKEIFGDEKWQELVEKSVASHPLVIKQHTTQELLNGIKEPKLASTSVLKGIAWENRDGVVLLHDIVNNNLSQKEALVLVKGDKGNLFTRLLQIESVPDHLGGVSVNLALRDFSLEKIQEAKKVAGGVDNLVNKFNSSELSALMIHGEAELDASTYTVMYEGLTVKMGQENTEGRNPLNAAGKSRFLAINEMAANFKLGGLPEVKAADFLNTNTQP